MTENTEAKQQEPPTPLDKEWEYWQDVYLHTSKDDPSFEGYRDNARSISAERRGYLRCLRDLASLREAAEQALDALHQLHPQQFHISVGRGICEWLPCKRLREALERKEGGSDDHTT